MQRIQMCKAAGAAGLSPRGGGGGRPGFRRARWTARTATAVVAAVSGSMLLAAAPAMAATTLDPPVLAFNALGTNHLWEAPSDTTGNPAAARDTGLTMAPGTKPAIVELYNPGGPSADLYLVAFEGNNDHLWFDGPGGATDTGLSMMPGTSPAVPGGQVYEICCGSYGELADVEYQSNTGELMDAGADLTKSPPALYQPGEPVDLGVKMDTHSSPAVAYVQGEGDVIAYHGDDGSLGVRIYPGGTTIDTGLGMMPGTSPSIIPVNNSGYEVAFNATYRTGALWTYGSLGSGNTELGLAPGTSPSIAQITQTTYQVAFNAYGTDDLYTYGNSGLPSGSTGHVMMAGTSPAIFGTHPSGTSNGYTVGYQTSTGDLAYYDEITGQFVTFGLGMDTSSSPGIAENGGIGASQAF